MGSCGLALPLEIRNCTTWVARSHGMRYVCGWVMLTLGCLCSTAWCSGVFPDCTDIEGEEQLASAAGDLIRFAQIVAFLLSQFARCHVP